MCAPAASAVAPHENDMYCPEPFAEARLDVLHELIRAHPLGTLVTVQGDALEADHIRSCWMRIGASTARCADTSHGQTR